MDQSERKLIYSNRSPGANFDLYKSNDTPVDYFDGIAGLGVGPNVCRLEMFSVTESTVDDKGEPLEKRLVTKTMVVPSNNLISTLISTMMRMSETKDAITEPSEMLRKQFEDAIEALKKA